MPKIGLEIHGYLETREKLFCRCKSIHGTKFAKPNTYICPICTGQPGAKPMLPNKDAVKKTIQTALILGCKINPELVWQRKHYDWPDLPKGYQNTISGTHASPIGVNGKFLGIRIREVHLEEDPASWNPKTGEIDYNRSGSPLIEIVTEPDFVSSGEVYDWLKQLIITLGYIKSIDKNLGLKADVNISLPELKGERIEVKNVNSLRNIKSAIEYEESRQRNDVPRIKETRMFDESKGITKKMREKEAEQDYRFISDPDLPVMEISSSQIEETKMTIPKTPQEKLQKLVKKYNIDKSYAEILSKKLEIAEFFENIVEKVSPKLAVPWVSIELLSILNYNKKEFEDVDIKPEHFVELLKLLEKKAITELKAKDILRSWIPKSYSPKKEAEKSATISSKKELEEVIKKVMEENPQAIDDYMHGEKEVINFLLGKVMQATNKRADFRTAKELLERLLR